MGGVLGHVFCVAGGDVVDDVGRELGAQREVGGEVEEDTVWCVCCAEDVEECSPSGCRERFVMFGDDVDETLSVVACIPYRKII